MPAQAARRIAVLGAGSWGTALAIQIARADLDVVLWDINPEHVQRMQLDRCNNVYLPDIPFPPALKLNGDLVQTIAQAETLLLAIPSHAVRAFIHANRQHIRADQHFVWATKGLEEGTAKLMHQVIAEELPQCKSFAVASGPTFAREVARDPSLPVPSSWHPRWRASCTMGIFEPIPVMTSLAWNWVGR